MDDFLPLGEWVDAALSLVIKNDAGTLAKLGASVEALTESVEAVLLAAPIWLVTAVFVLIGFWRVGWKFALFCVACLSSSSAPVSGTRPW